MTIKTEAKKSSKVAVCKAQFSVYINIYIYIYLDLSDFFKTWPPGFRLVPGAARIQASPVSKKIGGLTSWSAPAG